MTERNPRGTRPGAGSTVIERQAAALVIGGSAGMAVLGLFWQFGVQFLHLVTLLIMLILFAQIRRAARPFGMGVRCAAAALVLVPAFKGGMFLQQVWVAAVWFGILEFGCAAIRRRWMREVRHRFAVRRLERLTSAAAGRYGETKMNYDRVQEEVTLYQTVYDLATGQNAGMTRADIVSAAGQSLKELARRRRLCIGGMYLCLSTGETIDLRQPRHPGSPGDRVRSVKDGMLKKLDAAEPSIVYEGSWVGLAIRYQNRLIGGFLFEMEEKGSRLTDMDVKLFAVTADLTGLAIQNSLLYEQVNQMAITDRLTGMFVLWYFKDRLREEVHRTIRSRRPLSVLMMDLDHFKQINDTYGHLAGDAALRQVSARVRGSVREGDLVARYGGEEIVAILPETPLDGALRVSERIRSAIEKSPVDFQSTPIRVTISIGVNEMPPCDLRDDPALVATGLIKGADEALYRAKREGRNCVRAAAHAQSAAPVPAAG